MATRRKKKQKNQGKGQKGSKIMIMGIDHGYYAIKTRHFSFPAGVTVYTHEPYTLKNTLQIGGKYYVCGTGCALPGFVDSKNEEKTERNAGYLVVSHSGGGMLRQGTRKGIRRTPANRGMRAHRIVKSLDISEDVCHGMCP